MLDDVFLIIQKVQSRGYQLASRCLQHRYSYRNTTRTLTFSEDEHGHRVIRGEGCDIRKASLGRNLLHRSHGESSANGLMLIDDGEDDVIVKMSHSHTWDGFSALATGRQ